MNEELKPCKGIRLRAEAKHQPVDRGMQVKIRLRTLKKDSCPGCRECAEIRRRIGLLGTTETARLYGLDQVEHGRRYRLRLGSPKEGSNV